MGLPTQCRRSASTALRAASRLLLHDTMSSAARKRWLKRVFFAWAGSCLVVVSLLMASHFVVVPVPPTPRLAALSAHGAGWRVTHVIVKTCACSQRVLAHLLERGVAPGFKETEDQEV